MGKLEMPNLLKRKNSNRLLSSIVTAVVLFFILLGNATNVQAEVVPVSQFDGVGLVDASGNVVSGPPIEQKKILALNYNGSDFVSDMTVQNPTNTVPIPYDNSGYGTYVQKGGVVRVKNAGYYKGKPIVLAFTADKGFRMQVTDKYILPYSTENTGLGANSNSSVTFSFWIETEAREKIVDSTYSVLMPFGTYFNPYVTNNPTDSYLQNSFGKSDGFNNVLVSEKSTIDVTKVNTDTASGTLYKFDYPNAKSSMVGTSDMAYGFIYPFSAANFTLYSVVNQGTYPTGTFYPGLFNYTTKLLDKDTKILVPLLNEAPVITDTTNEDTFKVKLDVKQALQLQGNDNFYSDQLDINITLPDYVKTKNDIGTLKVLDKDDNDITSKLTITSDQDGQIMLSISKAMLQELKSNLLSITGAFDLDSSSDELLATYDKDSGYFSIPIQAKNNDDDTEISSGTAKVKMPAPTGEAVPQSVLKDTSTDSLDPENFVKNLMSVLSNDIISVEGFETSKTFTKLGNDSVVVEISSTLTGVKSKITVPVTVIPVDQAILSWSNKEIKADKEETIDKSNVSENVQETIYWQTVNINSSYKLIAKKNGVTIASSQTSTATVADSWVSDTFKIPIDTLDFGANDLTIGIYSLTDDTTPLDEVTLTITLTGSIKVVSVPDVLSWTDRTTRGSKGTLSRDDGNTMTVSVIDTRNISEALKTWSLRAKTTVTNAVPFDLVWKSDTSAETKSLSSEVQVLTKSTGVKNGDTYTKTWNEATGVLLTSQEYMKVGDYSNNVVVNWYLYDTEMP